MKRYLWPTIAAAVIAATAYLIWEHGLLTTVGNYMRVWAGQFWELLARLAVQFWELLLRGLEIFWRFVPALVKNVVSTILTRPFGKLFAWFFAGYTLHYLVSPRVREMYRSAIDAVRTRAASTIAAWKRLPLWLRIVVVVAGAFAIALVNIGLLLLPLGFFIEPMYRYVRSWIAREGLERASFTRRFYDWVYRWTRHFMRASPLFRKCLWPLRHRRLRAIQHARRLHFEYRKKGEGVRDMLGDIVRREASEKEDRPGPP